MRLWHLITISCVSAGLLVTACEDAGGGGIDDDDDAVGGGGGKASGAGMPTGGTTGSGGGGLAPPGCAVTNLTFNDVACGGCAESQCCPSLQACDTSQPCLQYLGCLQQCAGDQVCSDDCGSQFAEGKPLLDTFELCLDTSCEQACGGSGSQICDSGLSVDDAACAGCLGTSCCDAIKACEADTLCLECITGSTASCEGGSVDEAVRDCWDTSCESDCGAAGF